MGFSILAGDRLACLGLMSTLPGKGRELKGYHVNSLKDELMTEICLNLITSVLFTQPALINMNKVLYNKYYCGWTIDLDYFFYSVRPGAEGPCGQLQMAAILMESFSWDPCVYIGLKVTFHTQKHAC